jgi:hypothetical protein
VICARLLPPVLEALERQATAPETCRRLADVRAEIDAVVPGGLAGMGDWMSSHGLAALPPLDTAARERVAAAARASSSMAASPVRFDAVTLAECLAAAQPRP